MTNRLPDWFKTTPAGDRLTGRQLRVLLSVCVLRRAGGTATVRGVAELCKVSATQAHAVLRVLRARGFVTWHPDRCGTIVPLVAVALARRDGPDAPEVG